jgi:hypothetical protein
MHRESRPTAISPMRRRWELYRYYGMEWSPAAEAAQRAPVEAEQQVAQEEVPEEVYVSNDDAMTRSEEELRVQTVSSEVGRVRLKKWIGRRTSRSRFPSAARWHASSSSPPTARSSTSRCRTAPTARHRGVEGRDRRRQADRSQGTVRLEKDVVEEQRVVSDEVRKERITVETDIP